MGIRGESEFSRAFPFHTKCDMDQSQLLLLHKDRMAISELSIQAFLAVIVDEVPESRRRARNRCQGDGSWWQGNPGDRLGVPPRFRLGGQ